MFWHHAVCGNSVGNGAVCGAVAGGSVRVCDWKGAALCVAVAGEFVCAAVSGTVCVDVAGKILCAAVAGDAVRVAVARKYVVCVAVAEEIVRVALARGVGDNLYGCGRGGDTCGCGRGGILCGCGRGGNSCGCGRKVDCLAAAGNVQQFAWLWQWRQFVSL